LDKSHFLMFARYNQWANDRIYTACQFLPKGEVGQARPSFFGSILGTLNHLLVGDRLWLARITGGTEPDITALNQILHQDFPALQQERERLDARFIDVISGLEISALTQPLEYRTIEGAPQKNRLDLVLSHIFNHQTHHRGQVHDQLSQTNSEPPPLDLIYYLRQQAPFL